MEKPKGLSGKKPTKEVLSYEELMKQTEDSVTEEKEYKPKKLSTPTLTEKERVEFEKKVDAFLDKQVEAANDPKVFAKVLEAGEKLYASKDVSEKDKEMYWNLLTSSQNLEEATKYEKEIENKLSASETVKSASELTAKIDASSLSKEAKNELYDKVAKAANLEDLKKVAPEVEAQLFKIEGDTVRFSNNALTLGHIFPSESKDSVLLVDGKPAFLNPELVKDGKNQYCFANVDGSYGERAKVYSEKTKVKKLTEQEALAYFEHGQPRPVKVVATSPVELEENPKIKTEKIDTNVEKEEKLIKDRPEVAKFQKNGYEEL